MLFGRPQKFFAAGSLHQRYFKIPLMLSLGEMGFYHAEGATAPETLRQKDRDKKNLERASRTGRRRDSNLRQVDRWGDKYGFADGERRP